MSLRDKLKSRKPKQVELDIDGDKVIVRGLGRVRKNQMFAECQVKGKLDSALLESKMLAECVIDPQTDEPVMPDVADWDLPADVVGPMIAACIDVNNLDVDEVAEYRKKLQEVTS